MLVAVAVTAVVLVVVATLVVVRLLDDDDREQQVRRATSAGASFADVTILAQDDAERMLWTDWAGVRDEVGVDLGATSTPEEVDDFLSRGFDADLTSTTALPESALVMQDQFAFSPASLEWELFTQSQAAATLTMKLGDGVTTDDVATALRALGYAEPGEPDGVWSGNSDLPVAGDVTPELTFVSLDRARGIVFSSDQPTGVEAAVKAATEADSEPVPADVVSSLGSPLSAAAYNSTEACSALAMGSADESDQAEGDRLLAAAGKVNPVTGFGIGVAPGGAIRVTLGFDNEDQAVTNADSRAVLVEGPAPGQGGAFTDRFDVVAVSADGTVVTFDLDPLEGESVLSDLSTGPVLFATC